MAQEVIDTTPDELPAAPGANEHQTTRWLSTPQLQELAGTLGLPVPSWGVSSDPVDAGAIGRGLGWPVVVKADAGALLHKSDVGGVRLGLTTEAEVVAAVEDIQALPGLAGSEVLIQRMAPAGVELIVSTWLDEVFGPVLMLGSGGRLVELVRDVETWVGPLTHADALTLLGRLRCYPLLTGYRGAARVDLDALATILVGLSGATGRPMPGGVLSQLEVNPLIVSADGGNGVDMRATVGPARPTARHRPRPVPDLRRLFEPRTIAVVGASRRESLPSRIVRHLVDFGFAGTVFPVNRRAADEGGLIQGIAPVADIDDLPDHIDYGIVAVPATDIADTVRRLGRRAGFLQVITSGFGETGESGRRREEELRDAIDETGVRVLGPNCLGVHSTTGRVTFVDEMSHREGTVSVISQSGGLAADILRQGQARGVAFRRLATIGNAIDLGALDLLDALAEDDGTTVIGLYLEGIADGERLRESLSRAASTHKRVVLLHGGRSDSGARAVASHTGALTGSEQLWSAVARQTGALYVEHLDDFITALAGTSMLRPVRQGRLLLVGPSGGMSVLATDLADRLGLRLADLGPGARRALSQVDVPAGSSLANPIDTPAGALAVDGGALVPQIVRAATGDPGVDHVVVHLNPQTAASYTSDGEAIIANIAAAVADLHGELAARDGAPQILLALRANGEPAIQQLCGRVLAPLWDRGVPAFLSLEDALRAIRFSLQTDPATRPADDDIRADPR